MIQFYEHPRCSTCKKARAWLDENKVDYQTINLLETPPTPEQLATWMEASGLPIRRFFNTSGEKYRELGLKDQIDGMDIKEASELLATDGMLIKRPLMTDGQKLTLGFKEVDFEGNWI
ncbi:arsenate reductase family protein [Carnobacterium gallinarum]|uniref:arsenate reductase family protein n=1 Tax=Carnobacterium gallinarum TaxID=2749 RepID=UPI000555CDFE|nr:arsenate reductase family protein [Carnobacterium gallinarum]